MPNNTINLEKLFGPQTSCACEDCGSIHSPAAYFVDTLMFLGKTGRDLLFGRQWSANSNHRNRIRRPDLGEIQLSCDNTQTRLPYIDLVNEILEYAVVMPASAAPPAPAHGWPQTAGSEEDLAVNSQWAITWKVNKDTSVTAYDTLGKTTYGWDLPFDLWSEQARAYLGPLNVRRDELMKAARKKVSVTFQNPIGETWWDPTDVDVATEYLKLTPLERRLVTNRLSAKKVRAATTGPLNSLSGQQTVDGVALQVGDRILVKDQAPGGHPKNGIYLIQPGPWVRPPDADATRIHEGVFATVSDGGQSGTQWVLTTPDPADQPFVVDTDKLTFVKFVSAGLPDSSGRDKGEAWGLPSPVNANKWLDLTTNVQTILDQSGLSYDALVELLKTRFINPKGVEIQFPSRKANNNQPPTIDELTCDFTKATFKPPLADDALNRIPRFVRLQRKLGWTMRDLSRAIDGLLPLGQAQQQDMTDAFLVQLAVIQWLRSELKVDVPTALSGWANLDTLAQADGTPSLYERLFMNSAVLAADSNATFALNADRTELIAANEKISDHVLGVLAGLGVTAVDLSLLMADVPDQLTLNNLSALYRRTWFAQALGLSVSDFLLLRTLSGIDPFNSANPSDTRRIVEVARKVKSSGFSLAELNYLLRNVYLDADGIAPTTGAIRVGLSEIQVGLRKIVSDTSVVSDPTGETLLAKLTALFPKPNPATFVDDMMAFITTAGAKDASGADVLNAPGFITSHFGLFLDQNDALKQLVTIPLPLPDRYAYVLAGYQSYVRKGLSESFVKQKLAATLKLDTTLTNIIVRKAVTSGRSSGDPLAGRTALAEFLDPGFIDAPLPVGDPAFNALPITRTYRKLSKVALMLQRLRITADSLGTEQAPAWLLTYGWLDVNALPLDGPPNDASLFNGWMRLADFFNVWNGLPQGTPSLYTILDLVNGNAPQPTRDAFLTILSGRTGWPLADLQTLLGTANVLGFAWPGDFKDEALLTQLRDAFTLLRRVGVAAAQVAQWIRPTVDAATATGIRQAAKARLDVDAWTQVAKPIQDGLREKQRNAMVSYLVSQQMFADANDVYEWFLIDPEMSACMLTTRLKQAIGSVQLFIQRALMNLEDGVQLESPRAKEWVTWRKSYRVWQAARKVFLYPENWIEPELRDDKTPFFKELENELQQRDLNLDSAEDAFRHYLEKLDEVARLEMMGMFHDTEAGTLHVFGRTFGTPHVYYYRNQQAGVWSPWEKVNVDIQGDHLVPVIHNRRLCIVWPVFREKPNNTGGKDASTHREIQIAWSEYKNSRWTPKKISSAAPQDVIRASLLDGDERPNSAFLLKAFEVTTPPKTFIRGGDDPPAEALVGEETEPGDLVVALFRYDIPRKIS